MEWHIQRQLLFDDGDQYVHAHSNPDLRLHRVFGRAEEMFDAQVLLDPFEKQFDLPALFVKGSDGRGWQYEIVGEEDEPFACFGSRKRTRRRCCG